MKKLIAVVAAVLALSLTLAAGMPVFADNGNVLYTGNGGDFVFSPGSRHSLTDLFTEFKNVMPGASITQTITVKNNADDNVTVKFYLKSTGATEDSNTEFLNQLRLSVTALDNTPLFDASPTEIDGLADWQEIGRLYSGASADLALTLTVPTTVGNEFQKQMGKITWQFMIVEIEQSEPSWICPVCDNQHYRIIDYEEYSVYRCENCGYDEIMICPECGEVMHKVIYKDGDNKMWFYYECSNDEKTHTIPKRTGDYSMLLPYCVVGVGICFLVIILVVKRKKRKNMDMVNDEA